MKFEIKIKLMLLAYNKITFRIFKAKFFIALASLLFLSAAVKCQPVEKVSLNDEDNTTNYYLAIPPTSGNINVTLVLLCPYRNSESILPETMLHNVAAANDVLTVYESVGMHFIPGDSTLQHINKLMANVVSKYHADTSMFALPGYDVAGLSNEYWSAAFLYWLDKGQTINADVLKEMLTTYFDGLIKGNIAPDTPKNKIIPTKVSIQKIKTEADDIKTYSATINMLDFLAMKPITLNYMAHVKTCNDKNHFPVFAEVSLKPFSDALWNNLKSMKQNFVCGE